MGGGGGGLGEIQNIPGREKLGGLALKKIPAPCIDLQVFTIRPNFSMG